MTGQLKAPQQAGGNWGAYEKGFEITTNTPSFVVQKAIELGVMPRSPFFGLDLGCGKNLRNSRYLCALGGSVVAVDTDEIDMNTQLPHDLAFMRGSVQSIMYPKNTFDIVLMARLIQYISSSDLSCLIREVVSSLKSSGVLLLSYTASGGVLNESDRLGIDVFSHSKDTVDRLLTDNGLAVLFFDEGINMSTSVPHAGTPALTYDVIAQKLS